MKIGVLAKRADCKVVTIRFYEKKGLLPTPERSSSNYREYGEKDVERLNFIRHCRRHGINLQEIEILLNLLDSPRNACDPVHKTLRGHIENLESQIEDLKALKKSLEALLDSCEKHSPDRCGVLENLLKMDECAYCGRRARADDGSRED